MLVKGGSPFVRVSLESLVKIQEFIESAIGKQNVTLTISKTPTSKKADLVEALKNFNIQLHRSVNPTRFIDNCGSFYNGEVGSSVSAFYNYCADQNGKIDRETAEYISSMLQYSE